MSEVKLTAAGLSEQVAKILQEKCGAELTNLVKAAVEASHTEIKAEQQAWMSKMQASVDRVAGSEVEARAKAAGIEDTRGLSVGAVVRAMAYSKMEGTGVAGALHRLKQLGYVEAADKMAAAREKALATNDPTAGGVLVPDTLANELIPFLRPRAVVRALNPMIMPMPNGTVRVPKITSGASATYIGENTAAGKTQQVFGQITLTWKKLSALVPVSNDLIRQAAFGADAIVRDDLVSALASRENQAFIRDDGTSSTPKGLRYWVAPGNVFNANGTVNLANITTDLGKLILKLEENNVPMVRPAWIFAPRTKQHLMTIQTTTGAFAYRDEMVQGRLWGWPFGVTTQVPTNLQDDGSANIDESEIYLVDMADAVIGDAQRIVIDASTEAAYVDGGTVRAAFSEDQTVIRALEEHDFAMRRDVSVAVMKRVRWGA